MAAIADNQTPIEPSWEGVTSLSHTRRWLLFLLALGIAYGSLFPFSYVEPISLAAAWSEFLDDTRLFTSRGDVLGNIALFVPYGLFGVLLGRRNYLKAEVLTTATTAFALAFCAQVLQIYFPGRNPALADILWNMIGASSGIALGAWLQNRVGVSEAGISLRVLLPVLIIGAWLAAELVPFVPSLDWQQIKDHLKPLVQNRTFSLSGMLFHALGFLFVASALKSMMVRTDAWRWTITLMAFVIFAKLFVVGQSVDLALFVGFAFGALLFVVVEKLPNAKQQQAFVLIACLVYLIRALAPFELRFIPGDFHWLPFEALLQGSMLINAQVLAQDVFVFSGLLWLGAKESRRTMALGVAIALLVLLLEGLKVFIETRSGDFTRPLMVLLIAYVLHRLPRAFSTELLSLKKKRVVPAPADIMPIVQEEGVQRRDNSLKNASERSQFAAMGIALGIATGLALFMGLALKLPAMPYNVAELFLLQGNFFARFVFALALISVGAGCAWIGRSLATNRNAFSALASGLWLASLVTLLLLVLSVTQESLDDICGANNINWFVINRDIWGESMRKLFLLLDSETTVAIVERYVRFTALYGPVLIVVGILWACYLLWMEHRLSTGRVLLFVVCAVPWLVFCKYVAFTFSSTDNLNELIAHESATSLGGGPYLYFLLGLIGINAVALAASGNLLRRWTFALILTALAIPIGWWLLNHGLEQYIQKYDKVYSGVQFLLGPDRNHGLTDRALFWRWTIVQLGIVGITAMGIVLGQFVSGASGNAPRHARLKD